jgi:hypothetical protein
LRPTKRRPTVFALGVWGDALLVEQQFAASCSFPAVHGSGGEEKKEERGRGRKGERRRRRRQKARGELSFSTTYHLHYARSAGGAQLRVGEGTLALSPRRVSGWCSLASL